MGFGKVADVDVVAHPRAVTRRVVGTEDQDRIALAQCGLDRDLDQVRRPRGRLPAAPLWVGAGDVEVPERTVVERVRRRGVGQHPLGHQLRPAVRIDRPGRGVLVHRRHFGHAVRRRGAREDEVRHARVHRRLDKRPALHRVIVVILERVFDRFRHDNRAREMHHRTRPLLGEDAGKQGRVLDVSLVERHLIGNGEAKAGGQVVDHRDGPAAVEQRQHRVAADIAGAAGHEHGNRFEHCGGATGPA